MWMFRCSNVPFCNIFLFLRTFAQCFIKRIVLTGFLDEKGELIHPCAIFVLDVAPLFSCQCSSWQTEEGARLYSLKKKKTWTRVFLEHRWSGESRLDVVCSVEDAGIQSSTTCQVSDCSRGGRGVTAYTAVSWSVWFPLRWKNKLKQYSDQLWRQIKHTVFKRNISFTGLEIYCLHPGSIVFVKCKGMKKTFAVITVLKFLK